MKGTPTSVPTKPLDLVTWSGGRVAADRGALGWPISDGMPHGGYCPRGRTREAAELVAFHQVARHLTSP